MPVLYFASVEYYKDVPGIRSLGISEPGRKKFSERIVIPVWSKQWTTDYQVLWKKGALVTRGNGEAEVAHEKSKHPFDLVPHS